MKLPFPNDLDWRYFDMVEHGNWRYLFIMLFYQSKNNIEPKLLLSYHENGLRLKMILSVPQGSQKETFLFITVSD